VKNEQSLASKLKQEISAVNSSAQKQMQLEQEKTEAAEAERALVEKSLQAERQKVRFEAFTRNPVSCMKLFD